MELKILNQKENPLFKRKEIKAEAELIIVPSKKDVEEALSKKYSVSPENIKIKKIGGAFGSRVFEITANIYSSKEEKEKTEVKTQKERNAEKKASEESKKAVEEPVKEVD